MDNNLFTIGHSNLPFDTFAKLLKRYAIMTLIDVRSHPVPRKYSPDDKHFDRHQLSRDCPAQGIEYVYMGHKLGGDWDEYKVNGYVEYPKVVQDPRFQQGIEELLHLLQTGKRIALMCSEEDPRECHRSLLIGNYLTTQYGLNLQHIRSDGTVEYESNLVQERKEKLEREPALFIDFIHSTQFSPKPFRGK